MDPFKALSDPTRREILHLLSASEHTVGELVERFPISQPAISRHLAILRNAGLVISVRKGQRVSCVIDTTVVQDIARLLLDLTSPPGEAPRARVALAEEGEP